MFFLLISISPFQEVMSLLSQDHLINQEVPMQEQQSDSEEKEFKVKDQLVTQVLLMLQRSDQSSNPGFDTSIRLHQNLPDTDTPPPNF